MANYKDIISSRVPEYYQGDTQFQEYLEVCAELFDELSEAIDTHGHYNDYKFVPESRLAMLARKFAFNPPSNIPEDMMRGIIRDIAEIYSSKGTENSLIWIFRLLGWRATFEYAWLINPERYDPTIVDVFPQYYEREGLESDIASSNSVILRIGEDNYRIGVEDQLYAFDDNFFIDGFLRIGRNPLTFTGGGDAYDPFTPDSGQLFSTDFNKIDWRNFVYGKEVVLPDATYFYGRTPFSSFENLRQLRIIGEDYVSTSPRFRDVVMKTPYILVEVNAEDYDKFTQPYEDDGQTYLYTDSERFAIAETIINYFLYDTVRPSPVKVILIASRTKEEDTFNIKQTLEDEFVSEPIELSNQSDINDIEDYDVLSTVRIGTDGLTIGAPSFMPVNSLSVVPSRNIGEYDIDTYKFEVADNTFNFGFVGVKMYDGVDHQGIFYSADYPLRTPSTFSISTNMDVILQVKQTPDDEYIDYVELIAGETSYSFDAEGYNYFRLKRVIDSLSGDVGLDVDFTADSYEIFETQEINDVQGEATLDANFAEQEFYISGETDISVTVQWDSQVGYDYSVNYPDLIAA